MRTAPTYDGFLACDLLTHRTIPPMCWTPSTGATVLVRQLGGAAAEVVGLDTSAGEVLVKMGSITTRAPLAGISPV